MGFEIGDTVGDYQIIGVLGAGGMGRVYKVKNLISDRVDAMKILLPDLANEPDLADRFLREIKVLASLNHPNIAGLHTAFRLQNQLLMVMEFVQGTSLEEKLKSGALPVQDAIDYASQVLSALGYAHAQGVIHRDIKPANMMLTPENVVKLMDFGIAKSKTDRKLTMTGTTMGSLYYMPPEQVQGLALDHRSDLYSFGVSLYEMVTGSRPFKGQSDYDLMVAQLQKAPLPPIDIQPELPKTLNDIIMTALEKDPANRFQSAEAFRFALQSVRGAVANLPVASAQPVAPGFAGQAADVGAAPSATAVVGVPFGQPAAAQVQPTTPYGAAVPIPQVQPTPTPPPPAAKSYRGLYMTLGALVAILVIALGALQLPRLFKTKASGAGQVTQQAAATSTTPSSPITQPANPVESQPQQPVSGPASQTQVTPPAPSSPAKQTLPPMASTKRPRRVAGAQATAESEQTSATTPPVSAAPTGTAAAVNPPVQAAQPPAQDASAAKELEELEDRMTPLEGRAGAVKDSVDHLRQQQESAGYSLRQDMSASASNMQQYMGKAQDALNAKNPQAAKKYMDLAEREVEKLEKFFGR
ncbi:MAG: protein kinase [Terriglobia bacterium]|jgi:serine/threonine-protein kinase